MSEILMRLGAIVIMGGGLAFVLMGVRLYWSLLK